jgi:hypothetical protein
MGEGGSVQRSDWYSCNPDAAIAWLRSIPARYLPPSVGQDPAFAALRDRQDFRALFERQ